MEDPPRRLEGQAGKSLPAEKAGIFHGERIQAHNWDRAEREAWLEETKKSSM